MVISSTSSSTETQEHPQQHEYKTKSRKCSSSQTRNISTCSSSSSENTPSSFVPDEQPPILSRPSSFQTTKDLSFDRMTIEERTEFYEIRNWDMYYRILNDRTRRDTATKYSSTSLPRRKKDIQIEGNNAVASAPAIDQDTCMEEIFDLEL